MFKGLAPSRDTAVSERMTPFFISMIEFNGRPVTAHLIGLVIVFVFKETSPLPRPTKAGL